MAIHIFSIDFFCVPLLSLLYNNCSSGACRRPGKIFYLAANKQEKSVVTLRICSTELITSPKVALAVEYNGSQYNGWQRQKSPATPTVQGFLEKALSSVAGQEITVNCAGRTDSGVHACNQIVHFENAIHRSEKAWVFGGNSNLPMDIAVKWAVGIPEDFHARFTAFSRTYRYIICNTAVKPALAYSQLTWVRQPLNCELMNEEAQHLLGEQDFSSFRGAGCQSKTPYRCVESVSCRRYGELIVIEICANAFLLHMVRNIAGVLIAVGSGEQPAGWTKEVLEAQNRCSGGVTAKPNGLYLVSVGYPEGFGLPEQRKGPYFCPGLPG